MVGESRGRTPSDWTGKGRTSCWGRVSRLKTVNKYNHENISSNRELTCTTNMVWTASSESGTYRLCEQRRFRRACASARSRQNLRCSFIQAVSQEEPSDRNGWMS